MLEADALTGAGAKGMSPGQSRWAFTMSDRLWRSLQ